MANLTLPFSGSIPSGDVVFDVECNDGGGTAIRGQSLGVDQDGNPGAGISGGAENGGTGVSGQATGTDRFHDVGYGVFGSADSGGIGVYGEASGFDEADNSPAWGVAGYSPDGGIGVAGFTDSGGVGVYGESTGGFAMSAQGSTTQARDAGGWVKAMVHVVAAKKGLPTIDRSFNSQGAGQLHAYLVSDPGVFVVDFGFKVKDRFVLSAIDFRSAYWAPNDPNNLATGGWAAIPFDANGQDLTQGTLGLAPPVAIAMISVIGDTLVQVETFTLRMASMGGGAFAPSYTRANHNVTLTVL